MAVTTNLGMVTLADPTVLPVSTVVASMDLWIVSVRNSRLMWWNIQTTWNCIHSQAAWRAKLLNSDSHTSKGFPYPIAIGFISWSHTKISLIIVPPGLPDHSSRQGGGGLVCKLNCWLKKIKEEMHALLDQVILEVPVLKFWVSSHNTTPNTKIELMRYTDKLWTWQMASQLESYIWYCQTTIKPIKRWWKVGIHHTRVS